MDPNEIRRQVEMEQRGREQAERDALEARLLGEEQERQRRAQEEARRLEQQIMERARRSQQGQ